MGKSKYLKIRVNGEMKLVGHFPASGVINGNAKVV